MIRSSSHSIKFANKNKLLELKALTAEYKRVIKLIVDSLWLNINHTDPSCPKMLSSDYLSQFQTYLSARYLQCIGKQACAMVNAAIAKRKKQYYTLRKEQKLGNKVKYLQSKIDRQPLVKPNCEKVNLELDSRFVDFNSGTTTFDQFVRVNLGNKNTVNIPIKHTKVSNKWLKRGSLRPSIRLSNKSIVLFFEIEKVKRESGEIVGCDQGYLTVASLSDGQVTKVNNHGYDLKQINLILSGRKKNSKGFKKAQDHRENYINWSINQLDLSKVKEFWFERMRNLRKGKRTSREMSHWTYTLIKDKFVSLSEQEGFQFVEVDNEFKSQRCSKCGWVRKANRRKKTYVCNKCGHVQDSDLNSGMNNSFDLFKIPKWVRPSKINLSGFYWMEDGLYDSGHEPIVRGT